MIVCFINKGQLLFHPLHDSWAFWLTNSPYFKNSLEPVEKGRWEILIWKELNIYRNESPKAKVSVCVCVCVYVRTQTRKRSIVFNCSIKKAALRKCQTNGLVRALLVGNLQYLLFASWLSHSTILLMRIFGPNPLKYPSKFPACDHAGLILAMFTWK